MGGQPQITGRRVDGLAASWSDQQYIYVLHILRSSGAEFGAASPEKGKTD